MAFQTWTEPYIDRGLQRLEDGFATNFLDWIADGTFTPVLGAACPRIGLEDSVAMDRVAEEVRWELSQLPDKSGDRDFLRSLVKAKKVNTAEGPVANEVPPDLSDFRVAIITAASAITNLFGVAMARTNQPVFSAHEHEIIAHSTGTEGTELQRLRDRLSEAADALERLSSSIEEDYDPDGEGAWSRDLRLLLGPVGIRGRVKWILEKVSAVDEVRISMSWVEWLVELVWHSFRFRSCLYPSTEELAFQLAMTCSSSEVVDKVELALAAQDALHSVQVQDHIVRSLQIAADRPGEPQRRQRGPARRQQFYDAIAIGLLASFRSYQARGGERPFPVALTTNYDLELENALTERVQGGERFHVVIPVLVMKGAAATPPRANLEWLVATFPIRLPQKAEWEWCPNDLNLVDDLQGPVVVKLHGSPLHPGIPGKIQDHRRLAAAIKKDTRRSSLRPENQLLHATVVSEFEYLRTIAAEMQFQGFPTWLDLALRDPSRNIVFLGQSVQDWNIRLRLFFQTYYRLAPSGERKNAGASSNGPALSGPSISGRSAYALNKEFDPFRASLLRWLGVTQVKGDLYELARYLSEHEGLVQKARVRS